MASLQDLPLEKLHFLLLSSQDVAAATQPHGFLYDASAASSAQCSAPSSASGPALTSLRSQSSGLLSSNLELSSASDSPISRAANEHTVASQLPMNDAQAYLDATLLHLLTTSAPSPVNPLERSSSKGESDTNGPTSLYVKNLPPETTELFLYQKFSVHGALASCKVYTDSATGKCRGVAFINYCDRESALKAMYHLHGFRIRAGHHMHITLQTPRTVRSAQQKQRQLLQAAAAQAAQCAPLTTLDAPLEQLLLTNQLLAQTRTNALLQLADSFRLRQ